MKKINLKNSLSVLSALLLSTVCIFSVNHIALSFQKNNQLQLDCKEYNIPRGSDKRIEIDIEEGVVYIGKRNENSTKTDSRIYTLPLIKTKNSKEVEGCSPESTDILNEVQTVYQEYISESCDDFKNVLKDKGHIETKNGIEANIEGAEDFVKQFCN